MSRPSPKKKAEEIVSKYRNFFPDACYILASLDADEVIKEWKYISKNCPEMKAKATMSIIYWTKVKQEINKQP